MKLGVVGLPNVGKSTLFNAITKAGAEAANYPFCTIEPDVYKRQVLRARQRRASDHVGDVPNAVLTLDDLIFGVIHTIFSQIVLDAFDIAGEFDIARPKCHAVLNGGCLLYTSTTGRGRIACYALSALALAVCLLGGQLSNYEKLVSDQLDGTQDAYIAQFEREYALCEAAGPEDDVILPAWTVQTVTGKPTRCV